MDVSDPLHPHGDEMSVQPAVRRLTAIDALQSIAGGQLCADVLGRDHDSRRLALLETSRRHLGRRLFRVARTCHPVLEIVAG